MKEIFYGLAMLALLASCNNGAKQEQVPEKKVSIFADHIIQASRQQNISFREAAQQIKDMGYTGTDVRTDINPEYMQVLDELGFEHASAILDITTTKGDRDSLLNQAVQFLTEHPYSKILLCPPALPEDCDEAEGMAAAAQLVNKFVALTEPLGTEVLLEDYGNPRATTFTVERLDYLLANCPKTAHCFDSGNFAICGADAMECLKHFAEKIHHVHLKDRTADGEAPAIGVGILPMQEMMNELAVAGYNDWLTVEIFASDDMLRDAQISINNILGK